MDQKSRRSSVHTNADQHLPPWLQGVPLPPCPPSRQVPDVEGGLSLTTPGPIVADKAEDTTIPDWLRDLQSEVGDIEEEPVAADDEPDWLASLAADEALSVPDEAAAFPAAPPPDSGTDLPGWLRTGASSVLDDASARSSSDDLPDWLRTDASPVPDDIPADTTGTDLPDWLWGDASPAPPDIPAQASRDDLPDWLRSTPSESATTSDPFQSPSVSADEQTTPRVRMPVGATDWLRSLGEESDTDKDRPDIAEEPIAEDMPEQGIPDWLRNVSPDELARDIAAAEPERSAYDQQQNADLPPDSVQSADWLVDSATALSAMAQSSDLDALAEPALPDWLRDVSPDELERDIASVQSEPSPVSPDLAPGLPNWLRDISSGEDERDSGIADSSARVDDRNARSAQLPDWLVTPSDAQPPDPTASVPEWLQDASASRSEPSVPEWLQSPPMARSEADESSPAVDIPPWLQSADPEHNDDASGSAPMTDLAAAGTVSDVPDWLQSFDAAPSAPSVPDQSSVVDDHQAALPGWLRGDAPDESSSTQAKHTDVGTPEALPAWLMDPADLETGSSLPVTTPGETIPEWLRTDQPPAVEPAEELPEWMRDDTSAPETRVAHADPITPETPETFDADVPSWLRGEPEVLDSPGASDLPPWMIDDTDSPMAPATTAGDSGLPAWLRGADKDPESAVPTTPPVNDVPVAEDVPPWLVTDVVDPDAPPWLQPESSTAEPPATAERAAQPLSNESSDFFWGTDLPDWLRQSENKAASASEESRDIGWLSQLGVHEEESDSVAIATAPVPAVLVPPTFTRSPARLEAAALLQRLAQNPFPEAVPVTAMPELSLWQRLGVERILYILLALALLFSLIMPSITAFLGAINPATPEIAQLVSTIDQLTEHDIALVAYEWNAQRSSELRPLEHALIQHLIDNRVRMVVLSTNPQGTLLSFDLRDTLQAGGYQGRGFDYVLLGYRPGGEMALRSMAQDFYETLRSDFQGLDATRGGLAVDPDTREWFLNTLADLSLIVVMADQPQDVQGWIEQIHTNAGDVPLVFLLPFETAPVVQPYLRHPQVFQLVGKQGAVYYEGMRTNDQPNVAMTYASGQQHFAVLVFVILIFIGGIASALLHSRPVRENNA